MSDFTPEDRKVLNEINAKVTAEEPSFWAKYGNYIKYGAIAFAWLVGAISHKWGLFHLLSKLTN